MKLQIISLNKGFLMVEVMMAFSIGVLFILSTFGLNYSLQALKIWSLMELEKMERLVKDMDNGIYEKKISYGNDTLIASNDLFAVSISDYETAWGRDSCDARMSFEQDSLEYSDTGFDIGSSNPSTDIEVRNRIVYLTANSATASKSDFFIIDSVSSEIISSLNTGPGIAGIEIAGPYAFMAQASTVNQLQIIDLRDRSVPILISQLKLPLPTSTTTPPFAATVFYSKGFIFLGTTKWNGPEFSIIDVSNILEPIVVGSFETGTLINDIYVRGDIAYLASSDEKQMRVIDVSDRTNPTLVDSFSPSGWQTQEGRVLSYFEGILGLGRTVGGFNVTANHEAFIFGTSSDLLSRDIPGGVYGMLIRPPYVFLLTRMSGKEFQIFDIEMNKISEFSFTNHPSVMTCDGEELYFATGDSKGFSKLKLK